MKTKDLFSRLPARARVLLIRLRSMGDCLLLTGPVRALKDEYPGFRISVLVESRFAPCFEGNPDFEEIIPITKKSSGLRLMFRRFHAVLNLHGGPTSLAYAMLAWGPRIGAAQYQYGRLYQDLFPAPDAKAHTALTTMSAFQWLGLRQQTAPPLRFGQHEAAAARMHDTLQGRPYVVMHPGALLPTKRWSSARFAELGRYLQSEGFTVVLTCGPGEEAVAAEVAQGISSAVILLGLTIPELGELIRGARLYAGNDSGPMHLAAAVGTPVLALWGSSDSNRWHPWGVAHRVVQNPFECNPCPGYRCLVADTPLCIESVTVEQAIRAAGDLLKNDHETESRPS